MASPIRRRRRIRGSQGAGASNRTGRAVDVEVPSADAGTPAWDPDNGATAEPDLAQAERGLRGLVGGGSSQVTPTAALRARDAARPRPEDLERAEAELTIVRRNWTPDTPFPRR